MGNVVLQRYLKNAAYVKNSASEAEQRKFRALVDLFRTSGDRYDLPWLLLAAQGYQESQLDQSRRSHAGAVGVMQVKPSTAEGPPVFIKGVDKSAERNIEAGAKYLRFIVDEYYKDEPMDRLTKGLFALASYNAGPARVAGLRRKAERVGLDPNQWFQNVEVIAAREIGRETVQYVANIYKYYVAYKLISEQRQRAGGKRQRSHEAGGAGITRIVLGVIGPCAVGHRWPGRLGWAVVARAGWRGSSATFSRASPLFRRMIPGVRVTRSTALTLLIRFFVRGGVLA